MFLDVFDQGPGIPVNISQTSSTAFTMLISHTREAQGGETSSKSEEGRGSTFRVSPPLVKYSSTGPLRKGSQ